MECFEKLATKGKIIAVGLEDSKVRLEFEETSFGGIRFNFNSKNKRHLLKKQYKSNMI